MSLVGRDVPTLSLITFAVVVAGTDSVVVVVEVPEVVTGVDVPDVVTGPSVVVNSEVEEAKVSVVDVVFG